MIVRVPAVLSADQVAEACERLGTAAWGDGRVTAGWQSAETKVNLQLPHNDVVARELGDTILRALERNPLFVSATLPRHVFPPLFNRYDPGMSFGTHVDNAVRQVSGTTHRIRTDISATLFLSAPEEYDGGELVVDDSYGAHSVKLAAGDLILYPASSLHRVQPITRGARTAAFFWIQSMVRDDGARTLLFEMDAAIRDLTRTGADRDSVVRLTGCYHNLLRRWAEV